MGDDMLQEGMNYEIVNGRANIVARPDLNHLTISFNVGKVFERFIDNQACRMFIEADLHLGEGYILIPDVMIICDKDKRKGGAVYGAPDLIVEVISPSSVKLDLSVKKDIYEQQGVKEYWLIYPESRMITIYQNTDGRFALLDVYTYRDPGELEFMTAQDRKSLSTSFSSTLFSGLTVNLEEIFRGLE